MSPINPPHPTPTEGEVIIPNFQFTTGQLLAKLKLHYITHTYPAVWQQHLAALLEASSPQ